MIFDTLEHQRVPFIVIKYLITVEGLPFCDKNQYEVLIERDDRFRRLGFKTEREIWRYRQNYMNRPLSLREVKVFFSKYKHVEPDYEDETGTAWKIDGGVRKRVNPRTKRAINPLAKKAVP